MYHAVSRDPDPYSVTPEVFRRQMSFVASRYAIVRLRSIPELLARPRSGRRAVAVTFDDAYCDFQDSALPVLASLGVPATVFVPTGQLGGHNRWDAGGPFPQRPVMNAGQLREVQAGGLVDIGSHTVDHVHLAAQTADEMWRQTAGSRQTLEDILGAEVRMFAYPYGQLDDYSSRTEDVLVRAGYRIAVTTHWGTRAHRAQLLRLRRIWLTDQDGEAVVAGKVEGSYDWKGLKEKLGFVVRRLGLRRPP
jgi:peptidoglycan/xylan/chitin deacetylase (PgdA/CDA1 family)